MPGKNGTADKANHYGPSQGYTKLPNKVVDKWGRHVVQSLGSAHAWALTVVVRLTIGYGKKSREVSAPALARLTGLSRARVCEVLEDLEAVGIVTRERRPGCSTRLGVNLEWQPTREALEKGKRLRRERSKRKHPDDEEDANPSTPVDTSESSYPSTGADGLPYYPGGRPNPSTPVDTTKDSTYIETISIGYDETSENGESLPKKESFESENGFDKSTAREEFFSGEKRKTPPSSSSYSVGKRDPGEKSNSLDGDEKTKNVSKSKVEDNDIQAKDYPVKRTAAKESWQEVSDEIKAISEERLTEEARALGEVLAEKVPRIEAHKAKRLSLYCIENSTVGHLATVVSAVEKKLKFDVQNPWAYLVKALGTEPGTESQDYRDASEQFEAAYEAARTRYTLGGQARKYQYEGVARRNPIPTDAYLEKF